MRSGGESRQLAPIRDDTACAATQLIADLVVHAGRGFHASVPCVNEEQPAAAAVLRAIVARAREHRATPMAGRTHGIHAEPTTFGAKVEYQQQRVGTGFALEEARLRPLHGMPVTILATDRPD